MSRSVLLGMKNVSKLQGKSKHTFYGQYFFFKHAMFVRQGEKIM
jgi:hypothetical protein